MAKRKNELEEDEADSKSEGEGESSSEKPTAKKAKAADSDTKDTKSTKGKGVLTNKEGEQYIDLGKKRHVTVRGFKGQTLIDIREFYGADGDEKPGKKGIALSPDQWNELKENMSLIDELISSTTSKK